MSLKIAIASGKGGTGKTTIALNLQFFFWKYDNKRTLLVDCDVEEPNDLLFFKNIEIKDHKIVYQMIPEINTDKCTFCKRCVSYCEFNAIVIIQQMLFAEINNDLCHSCGACSTVCNFKAIKEKPFNIGEITFFNTGIGNGLMEGKLRIGSPMQTMVIKKLKNSITGENELIIFDAPPGTSCPVVETISDVDYVILVTEPTPFGFHDLKLTVELLKKMNKPFGVIINKSGLGNRDMYHYLKKENIELLGEVPFNKNYAGKYASGEILENITEKTKNIYLSLIDKIESKLVQT